MVNTYGHIEKYVPVGSILIISYQLKIMYDNHLNIIYDTLLTIPLITITGKHQNTRRKHFLFIYVHVLTR